MKLQESRWTGRVLRDKWRIDGRIARGGMGTVFAATHRNNGSTAAIKILHPQFSRDEDTRSRFLQEGYAANQVGHPGVVRILDDDVTEEGLAYLVMELLEGELVEQRRIRKGGKLPLAEVYEFADQLLDVLAAAHEKGIVHRDVKPDNIFLTQQGRLKVLDFGFAQMRSGFRTETTATGFLLGTPGFMAPEQAMGNRPLIDARTDIWAVGATMFMLLTGQPVHPGESAAEMLVAAANFPVRSIMTLEPGLPTKLSAAVDRALAFDKNDRWPDARTMQSALRAVPGRQTPKEHNHRMSVVDDAERRFQRSLEDSDPDIVEIADEDLHERSGETAIVHGPHPADLEKPTLAVAGDGPTMAGPYPRRDAPPSTKRLGGFPGGGVIGEVPFDESTSSESTVVMHGRPLHPAGVHPNQAFAAPTPRPAAGLPPSQPRQGYPSSSRSSAPDAYIRTTPPAFPPSRPAMTSVHDPISYRGPNPIPTVVPPSRSAGSRVLLFIVVAGITMIVVILTGLLVILGSD